MSIVGYNRLRGESIDKYCRRYLELEITAVSYRGNNRLVIQSIDIVHRKVLGNASIDGHCRPQLLYQSNIRSGLRVLYMIR